MRFRGILALAVCGVAISTASAGERPKPGHPILGGWRFVVPGGQCAEIYTFKPDGTRAFTSAAESGESKYEIADSPSESGSYRLTDTVTRTNGKPDCAGRTTPIGDSATIYVRFHPSSPELIMCGDDTPESCFGPFTRVKDAGGK